MLHLWRELNDIISQIQSLINDTSDLQMIKSIIANAPLEAINNDGTVTINLKYDDSIFTIVNNNLTFKNFLKSNYTIPINVTHLGGYPVTDFYTRNTNITFDQTLHILGSLILPTYHPQEGLSTNGIAIDNTKLIIQDGQGELREFHPDAGQVPASGFDYIISDLTNLIDITTGGEGKLVNDLTINNDVTINISSDTLVLSGMYAIMGGGDYTLHLQDGTFTFKELQYRNSFHIELNNATLMIKGVYDDYSSNIHITENGGNNVLIIEDVDMTNIRIDKISNVRILNSRIQLGNFGTGFPLIQNCQNITITNTVIERENTSQAGNPLIKYGSDYTKSNATIMLNDVKYELQYSDSPSCPDNTCPFQIFYLEDNSYLKNLNFNINGLIIEIPYNYDITSLYAPIEISVLGKTDLTYNIISENYFIIGLQGPISNLGMFLISGHLLRGGDNNAPQTTDSSFIDDSSTKTILVKNIFGGGPIETYDINPTQSQNPNGNTEIWIGNIYLTS